MTMLSLVVKVRPSTSQLSFIGQELSLVFSTVAFVPIMAQHTPGFANVAADAPFRWHQLGKPRALPLLYCVMRALVFYRLGSTTTSAFSTRTSCRTPGIEWGTA